MPVAIVGPLLQAGEFAYDAANAGTGGIGGPIVTQLTPDEEKFFELQSLQAQKDSAAQTAAYEKSDATQQTGTDLVKWGLGISGAYLAWRVARKMKWI